MSEQEKVRFSIGPGHLARWGTSAAYVAVLLLLVLTACTSPREAPRAELALASDSSAIQAVTSDLGYEVELTEARAAVENFAFTVAGEAHTTSLWQKLADFVVPNASAHPGHFQGGDVTGELRGRILLNWLPPSGRDLGTATLLPGVYKSAQFTFVRGSVDDGLALDDPLIGHTALLRGRASRGAVSIGFVALIDTPEDRKLIGAPFEMEIKEESRGRLGVRLATRDPLDEGTLFDGLDFGALDGDGDGAVVIEESSDVTAIVDATNRLRRNFQTHDHFDIKASLSK